MVTTRSADKRAKQDGQSEKLALRSKPDDGVSPLIFSDSEISLQGSVGSKSGVVVNVPRPRRPTGFSQGAEVPSDENEESGEHQNLTQDEIPDSQETPSKSMVTRKVKSQPASSAHSITKRKRESTSSTKATPAKSSHKRFGSEGPSDVNDDLQLEDGKNDRGSGDALSKGEDDDHDDDDAAPEETSTKQNLASKNLRTRRTTRSSRAGLDFKDARPAAITQAEVSTSPIQGKADNNEAPETGTTPILRVDTNRHIDLPTVVGSEGSQDTVFETARSERHVDVFSTPRSSTSQMTPPSADQTYTHLNDSVIATNQLDLPVRTLGQETDMLKPTQPKIRPGGSPVSSATLPRKAHNSVERYRQTMLQNRAQKSAKSGQAVRFRLQETWPAKRRKFVTSY